MKKSFTLKLFALLLVVGLLFAAVPTGQVQAQFYRAQAINDNYETEANVILSVDTPGVLSNDSYISSHFRAVEIVNGSDHGTLTMEDNGSFTYEPDENFVGTDTFEYKIRLRFGITYYSNTATVTIMVTPKAVDDEYTTAEDVILSVDAPGVLLNDPDYNAITMTAVKASSPAHGVLVLASDGSFVYTPDQDYYGTDSFTYYYTGGVLPSNIATVTITVTPVKDQVIANDDEYDTNEGVTLTVDTPGVLDNDIDVDDNTMTASLVSGVSDGTLTLNGDGSFVYIPDAGFTGTDYFTYKLVTYPPTGPTNSTVQDLWTDEALVTIRVHAGPAIESIVAIGATGFDDVTAVGTTLTVDQGYKVDTIEITMSEDVSVALGTVVTIDPPGGNYGTVTAVDGAVITVTPDTGNETASKVGTFEFSIPEGEVVSDPEGAAWENVPVYLVVENVAPVAEDQSVTTPEDTAIGITLVATDAGDDELTYEIVDEPTHGTVDLVDDVATYTPDLDYHGMDSFTFKANDGNDDSNLATVSITITPVKDQVEAVNDEYETQVDITLTVPAPGVLENDIDVDENIMTAILVSDVSDGTLTLNGDGSFVYIPDAGFTGTDTFEYELVTTPAANSTVQQSLWTDIATVTIEVLENVAPVAVDDAYTTEENMVLNILKTDGVLANDIDFDWTILTAVKVTDPGNGTLVLNTDGSFTYTPNTGFTGVDIFTYKANDGEFDSNIATVRITVEAYVNTPVVAEDDYYETMVDTTLIKDAAEGVLANDTLLDPEEIVTVQILDEPQHGTLTMEDDGSFIYIPDAGFMGRDTFRYIVFSLPAGLQAEWSDDAWVYIDVKPVMRLFLPIILR